MAMAGQSPCSVDSDTDEMQDARVGRIVRALRRRRRWRQADLALRAGIGQTTVSLIERGHLEGTSLSTLRRVFGALDASIDLEPRWRGGALDRLLDERHAALVGFVVRHLRTSGWETAVEVTFAVYGERGAIDVLAIRSAAQAGDPHGPTRRRPGPPGHRPEPPGHRRGRRTVLVVEVKTELTSVEAMLRTLDVKVRLAPELVAARFGRRPSVVGRLVGAPADSTVVRRTRAAADVLEAAIPARGWAVRRWISDPAGPLDGLWLVSTSSLRAVRRDSIPPQRVSRPRGRPVTHEADDTAPAPGAVDSASRAEEHRQR
jgi:transcriptional regulator with XRE-family HTH domain